MFSKTLLVSLLVSAVVAAPAPAVGDAAAPPIIKLESNVSCTSVVTSSSNPSPSPTVILLNSPSPVASGYYGDYAAPVQPSVGPDIIKLNAPAGSPPVIKLNKRQLSPASTSSFSFGGIVPSSTPALFPPLLSTTSPSSGSFGSSATPPLSATTNPAVQGGPPAFTTTGANGYRDRLNTLHCHGDRYRSSVLIFPRRPQLRTSARLPSAVLRNNIFRRFVQCTAVLSPCCQLSPFFGWRQCPGSGPGHSVHCHDIQPQHHRPQHTRDTHIHEHQLFLTTLSPPRIPPQLRSQSTLPHPRAVIWGACLLPPC
ncbi:hypothetical protein EDB86DRAFT_2903157, partial [Lactarius hatsudake]